MKIFSSRRENRGMTLIELLTILAIIAALAALWFSATDRAKARAIRIACVSNLKQTGLAFKIWKGDNVGRYPMAVPITNGGSMEFTTGPNVFRHFQVMSNELSSPIVVICPSEEVINLRRPATNFTDFNNSNISYFVGVDATDTNANMVLAGDHNITNGTPLRNGLLELTAGRSASWTAEMHKEVGNIALADGSVQQESPAGLQNQISNTGVATNRLQMPVLEP